MLTFGQFVKRERTKRGWSQLDMEKRSGGAISQGSVASWEVGKARDPGGEVYAKIARLFGMSIEEVYSAVGLTATTTRRETARDLLQRAMVKLGEPLPVHRFAAYSLPEEGRVRQATGEEVHVPAAVADPRHHLEAYELESDFPPKFAAGEVVIIDRDADIEVGDYAAFVHDGVPLIGLLRRVGDMLWLESTRRCAFPECHSCGLVCARVEVMKRRLKSP